MTNVLKFGKQAFTWSVVVTTIFWSMGIAALVPLVANAAPAAGCPTLEAGDLFKVPGISSVYLLNANMNRLYFPHSSVYKTWYTDFSGVVEIPNTCVDAYPAPSALPVGVNYRSGSVLVKVKISPTVYAVEPSNKISKVGSEAVAAALYGSAWASQVRDIPDEYFPNYVGRGTEITEAKPHDGMLVKTAASSDVYYVSGGKKMKVDGTVRGDVRTVSQTVFDTVAADTGTKTAASLYADPTQGVGTVVTPPTGTTPPAAAGTVTVSLAADTQSGGYAYDGHARVNFTKLNFTASGGDVTIKTFKVKRAGAPAINGDFDKINVVTVAGDLLNDVGKTLNSDNEVTFTEDLVIPSGQTKTWTIVADMASAVLGGNQPTLGLLSVETDSTVVGTLPMYGNPVTTNTNVALGSVTLAEGTTLANVTKQVGALDVDLASLKVTVATNDFQLERVVFYNASSTDDDDLQNFELRYNNNKIADGTLKDKYLTFDLKSCTDDCKIEKGNNKTFGLVGDIIGGSGRTADYDIKRATHVLVRDRKENAYVTPTNNATAMTNGITVSQGKINITKTDLIQTGNIPENANRVELGSFMLKVTGESIDVRTLVLRVSTTGTVVPTGFDQLTLYRRVGTVDTALTGGIDAAGSASPGYATSTDTFTLAEGEHTIVVKGNIDSTPVDADSVFVSIDMRNSTNFDSVGATSGEVITLGTYATPNALVSGNTLTIKTSALTVTHLNTPPTTTYSAGINDVTLADVELDASGSSEDLKVTQFKIVDRTDGGGVPIDIQNIRLFVDKDGDSYNGSGTQVALSETKNGSDTTASSDETYTFNLGGADQFTIKAGRKVVVTVKGSIAGGATAGSHVFKTTAANDVTSVGIRTGNEVSEVVRTTPAGTKVTVGTSGGTIQVSLDPSNPDAKSYAAGTTGVTLAVYNFLATTTEDVELDQLTITQRVTDTNSSAFADYALVYLVDEGGNTLASQVPTSTGVFFDLAADKFVVPINDTDGIRLTVKANLATIGSGQNVTVGGHHLGYNIADVTHIVGIGDRTGVGSVEYLGTSAPNGNTHLMFKGTPTIEVLSIDGKLAATADMFKFKVSANRADVGLYKFTFDITTSSVSLTQLELYDVTESNEVLLYSSSTLTGWVHTGVIAQVYLDDDEPGGPGVNEHQGEERTVSTLQPRTYVLRGNFTGVSSGDSVTTRLAGDSALADGATGNGGTYNLSVNLMASSTSVDAGVHDDFIWSDRSASGHATTTLDWTNGYLVNGVASVSSTAKVLSL